MASQTAPDDNSARAIERFNQAVSLHRAGDYAGAVMLYDDFIHQFPMVAAGYANLGQALCDLGRCDDAIEALETALRLDNHANGAFNNLISVLHKIGQTDYAEALCWQQLERYPDEIDPYINLGATLSRSHKFEAAWHVCRAAPASAGESAMFQRNLGRILTGLGRRGCEAGIAAFRRCLALDDSDPISHLGLAEALLRDGQFREGWAEYQAVLKSPALPGQPWNGEALDGKTILIHKDGGFGGGLGDVIHLSRYVPILHSRGADILFAIPAVLHPLFRHWPTGITVTTMDGDLSGCRYRASLMDVVRIQDTGPETIPAEIPYVSVPADRVAVWRQRLAGLQGYRVGLVWSGHNYTNEFGYQQTDHRRAALQDLEPLLRTPGVDWVSLQLGDARREIGALAEGCSLLDAAECIVDFGDSAAVIACLDLVISIDTSTAHLAGAMGKPVWILLSAPCCWRWLYDRSDSPWYPTARLFRQKSSGGWSETIHRVGKALRAVVAGHAGAAAP